MLGAYFMFENKVYWYRSEACTEIRKIIDIMVQVWYVYSLMWSNFSDYFGPKYTKSIHTFNVWVWVHAQLISIPKPKPSKIDLILKEFNSLSNSCAEVLRNAHSNHQCLNITEEI